MTNVKLFGPATGSVPVNDGETTIQLPHVQPVVPLTETQAFASSKRGARGQNNSLTFTTNGWSALKNSAGTFGPTTFRNQVIAQAGSMR